MKKILKNVLRISCYCSAAIIILAAVLMSIAHLMTPLLNRHRADLEVWASQILQVPIAIGEVHADWRGNIPELTLTHVFTLDKNTHKPAFDIREIKIGFQVFSSLWKRQFIIQDIIISGADLTVLQDASGGLTIKDLDLPVEMGKANQSYQLLSILDWLFSQPYLALREIDVHLQLYNSESREFTIKKVSLINSRDDHQINGNFILHQEIPTEIRSHINWTGNLSDPDHIQCHAYLDLEGFSLSQWIKETGLGLNKIFSGWQLHQGIGGAEIWVDWDNAQLQQVQSVFQWYDLEFYSDYDQKTYPIESFSGHVGWKRSGERQIFAGNDILINFPGHYWPATTFYMVFGPRQEAEKQQSIMVESPVVQVSQGKKIAKKKINSNTINPSSVTRPWDEKLAKASASVAKAIAGNQAWRLEELHIGYVDLQDLMPIVMANSSVPNLWRKQFFKVEPLGEIQAIEIAWFGEMTDLTKTSLSAIVKGLNFNPWDKYPGIAHFSGKLKWNGNEGELQFDSKDFMLTYPALFANKLDLQQLKGKIDYKYSPDMGWLLTANQIQIIDEDLQAQGSMQLQLPSHASPSINMKAEFSLDQLSEVERYLPSKIMDADLVAWLKDAFLEGRLEFGKVMIEGKLNDFPFENGEGRFEASGELKDLDFHYAPQWPHLQQADGKLIFSGRSMTVKIDSAVMLDIPFKNISGVIPYLGADQPQILDVHTEVETDLAQGLEFIHQSPLEEDIGKDVEEIQMKGPAKLDLKLTVPLGNPRKLKVLGNTQIRQAILSLPEWGINLDQINGEFQFTEKTLTAKKMPAKLWGEPSTLSLSTVVSKNKSPSYIEALLVGRINVANVQTATALPLSNFLSGSTDYQARVKLYESNANNEVLLTSHLQGVAVDLPSPFGKTASEKRDFSLNLIIQQSPGFQTQLKYGDLIQAQLNIKSSPGKRIIDIDSRQMKGRLTLAYPFNANQAVDAQLDRLIIDAKNEKTISSLDPHAIPPLNISCKQFVFGNKNLGQLNLNTSPKSNGLVIQNFILSEADFLFRSKGQWTGNKNAQQSQLSGTIESSKVTRFLERIGLNMNSLIVDKGRAAFDLQWKGAPYSFSLATMSGNFSFALEKGRVINLSQTDNNKMDVGRMLSLFSLQTIPRRLSLDFSDLFEKGYSFDYMRGDFSLRQGSAYTLKPAVFEGPVARIAASGRIGFLAQDYDLTLSISPYVTESLPVVAGALTLNPFVGAATWLVNKMVISKEVSKAATYNYKVTGSWNTPVWRKV